VSDDAHLADELAREREEVERLRGLLVTRDEELGAARGRVLQLETRWRYLLGIARRARAAPTVAREAVGGLRGRG
jgi:hypothetical protein